MKVRHLDGLLARLESDLTFHGDFGRPIVKAFRKVMGLLRATGDERALRAMKSLHFEKLAGKRSHQFSVRLNDQFRLILQFEGQAPEKQAVVVGIEDYH